MYELRRDFMGLNVRLPLSLLDHLRKASEKSGRSLNAEIVYRLQRSLAQDQTEEKPEGSPTLDRLFDEP